MKLKEQIDDDEQSATEWIELTERAFTFCQNAPYWFKNGSIQDMRIILTTVGSNLILLDKKLTIESDEFFVAVKAAVESDNWLPRLGSMRMLQDLLIDERYWQKTTAILSRM